jgi:hypothetical protein
VTSGTWTGEFGSLEAADLLCEEQAQIGGLGTGWKALLSDAAQDVASRVVVTGVVRNMNGDILALDSAGLWDGVLDDLTGFDQFGQPTTAAVWTGSTELGGVSMGFDCDGWAPSSGQAKGMTGHVNALDSYWIEGSWQFCTVELRGLYCLSQ